MNPFVSTSALQYCQKDFFFAETNNALMFPICRDSCAK